MKFTVPSNELMQHLQACARAISPKSTTLCRFWVVSFSLSKEMCLP